MNQSPSLKADWFGEISILVRNKIKHVQNKFLKIFPQNGSKETGRCFLIFYLSLNGEFAKLCAFPRLRALYDFVHCVPLSLHALIMGLARLICAPYSCAVN